MNIRWTQAVEKDRPHVVRLTGYAETDSGARLTAIHLCEEHEVAGRKREIHATFKKTATLLARA